MSTSQTAKEAKAPHDGKITVRRIAFEFPDDIEPRWKSDDPEWSHMINGASLTMPYLEPFLIDSMRDALKHIEDPAIREAAKGFIAQEGQHYRQHRRYNELLKAKGYPELAAIEDEMQVSYDKMRAKRSLRFRMGFTAGFESMTLGVTSWLIEQRRDLFRNADSRVSSFILWHMVEETEHKRVAYDVYQAACPGYFMRALGVFTGSLHVMWYSRKACIAMLKKDGQWNNLASRMRLWRRTAQFASYVLPFLFRSTLPGHDPAQEADPIWVRNWIDGYAEKDDKAFVPLIDTASADMLQPYATTS
ncbi:MAG: putative metal-dependent hydrolase [Hyphomicrobiaceae bacterium]|jgi:predicted metal-dependent hydrolase